MQIKKSSMEYRIFFDHQKTIISAATSYIYYPKIVRAYYYQEDFFLNVFTTAFVVEFIFYNYFNLNFRSWSLIKLGNNYLRQSSKIYSPWPYMFGHRPRDFTKRCHLFRISVSTFRTPKVCQQVSIFYFHKH